jgi:hypothetical protein
VNYFAQSKVSESEVGHWRAIAFRA